MNDAFQAVLDDPAAAEALEHPALKPLLDQASDVLLKVENLSLPWPGHARGWRLKDVSFELRRGEVLGIAGLMGAGRTELLECLFGAAAEPPQGRIELLGKPVLFRHPREARAAGIALRARRQLSASRPGIPGRVSAAGSSGFVVGRKD